MCVGQVADSGVTFWLRMFSSIEVSLALYNVLGEWLTRLVFLMAMSCK